MAYTRSWSDTTPPGSQASNTIDDEIRNLRVDISERMADLVPIWTPTTNIFKFSCAVGRVAVQSIVTSTLTALAFDTEIFDNGGLHDNAVNNSRITIPTNGNKGVWLFHIDIAWAANATGVRQVFLRKNGATQVSNITSISGHATNVLSINNFCLIATPAVSDYFEAVVFQDSGGNLDVNSITRPSFSAIHLL